MLLLSSISPAPAPVLALFDIGGGEMMLIFIVVLLLFGGKRMPDLARGLGKSLREFKKATSSVEEEIKSAIAEEPERPKPVIPKTPAATPAVSVIMPPAASPTDAEPANEPEAAQENPSTPSAPKAFPPSTDPPPP
jgi:sec-independent protein translocase protein TatA